MTKKVLIITYFFPPRQAVASQRLKGMAKYLPEFGWEPIILTPKLYGEIDNKLTIIQTPYKGNLRDLYINAFYNEKIYNNKLLWDFIEFPDSYKNWKKIALKHAREYLRENKVDAILSCSGPETTHLIAHQLKKEFNIPWIADFRDLWSLNQNYEHTKIRLFFDKIFEKKILSNADAVTVMSEPLVKIQSKFLNSQKVYSVPNGFDPDNFKKQETLSTDFTITYTGTIYPKNQNIEYLFSALNELLKENKLIPNSLKVNFWGGVSDTIKENILKYDLNEVVKFCGILSHKEILEEQRKSQILLCLNWEDEAQKGIYLAKIFEYLCCRRPILITGGNKNVMTELIDKTKAGIYTGKNTGHLKKVILEYYHDYRSLNYVPYHGIEEEINKFTQVEMAKKVSKIMSKIIKCR